MTIKRPRPAKTKLVVECITREIGVLRTIDGLIDHLTKLKTLGVPGDAYIKFEGDQAFTATTITATWTR